MYRKCLILANYAESGEPANVVNWLNYTTFDIIGELTFAESFGSLQSSSYHPWVSNFFKEIRGNALHRLTVFYPLLKPLLLFVLGSGNIKIAEETRGMAVTKSKARMAQGEQPQGRRDFTTYMLRKTRDGERGMSDTEILVNSPVLVGAGSETTASALSGFFFYMGQNSEAYKLLAAEIQASFNRERDITMKSTRHLQYLQACIEETLRMYPPAAETPPRISPGAEIDGRFIPKGTVVSVYQWATFRNPNNFANPDSFRPERWLPDTHPAYDGAYRNDNRAVFKPFSYGARDCIGKNLAYSEMRVIISRVMFLFDFELVPGQLNWHDTQTSFLVWEKGPLYVQLKPRKVG